MAYQESKKLCITIIQEGDWFNLYSNGKLLASSTSQEMAETTRDRIIEKNNRSIEINPKRGDREAIKS